MMRAISLTKRAFERSPGAPFSKSKELGEVAPARKFSYERFMQVSIKHDYYNRSSLLDACPDFKIFPTAASSVLMSALGLLFKPEATGFSVFYDTMHEDILLGYLRRQVDQGWTRLSFVLALNNPYFMNFTALPIALSPASQNLYLTNQKARRNAAGNVTFDWNEKESLLPVVPVQFKVPDLEKSVKEIEVYDISGELVLCKPRCVPTDKLKDKNLAAITCEDAKKCKDPDDPNCQCADDLYLDLSSLPEDKYTIDFITFSGRSLTGKTLEILYTVADPTPLCLIDLLFTSPTGEDPDLYPIQNLLRPKKTVVQSIHYELRFEARETFWNYYVVPPSGVTIKNLTIEGKPAAVKFAGPWIVDLPNGVTAYRFISKKSLPFKQESPFRFRLLGELGLAATDATLVESLPVPSVEQVLHDEVAACLDLDQMLSVGTKGRRRLEELLSQCLGQNFDTRVRVKERLVRLKHMCHDSQSRACQELKRGCSKIYSDTYVYV